MLNYPDMITFRKLSKMAILAFKNGLRLHFDSFVLFENLSFPTATMLSVIAMEEFGKYFSLSAYVFYISVNENRNEEFEKEYLLMLYNHPFKQKACIGRYGFETSAILNQKVSDRYFENLKQRSIYVGFDREKGEILFSKNVNNPENINERNASKQLMFLNDMLIEMVKGKVNGIIEMDEDEVNEILNNNLLTKLENLKAKFNVL